MKIGFHIPSLTSFFPPSVGDRRADLRLRYERAFEICRMAEDLGFYSATIGHHRFDQEIPYASSPLTVLSALAARTKRLRLGTNIAILPLQDPVEFAEQAATIDEMSDGRLFLGVALGYKPSEFEMLGLNFKERVGRMQEAVEILRMSWSDRPVHFKGKHFEVNGATVMPKPLQSPGPPIFFGAYAEAAILRAARLGDGWLTDNSSSATLLAPQIRRFREEANKAGRAGAVVLNRKVGIGATRRQVEDEWLPEILKSYREWIAAGLLIPDKDFAGKLTSGEPIGLSDIPSDLLIAGSPEDCIACIRQCEDLCGCDGIIVDFDRGPACVDYEKIRASIELFGRKVRPACL